MKKNTLFSLALAFLAIFLFSCASARPVTTDIVEKYPLTPIEEIITSERTVQELMSDTRQYFKKNYIGISTAASQVDSTLISMRFYPTVDSAADSNVLYTCDFNVIVEFKDDGRMRFSTENVYIGMATSARKIQVGGHDWMMPQLGIDTDAIRIAAGKKYNEIITEMKETLQRIAAGKNEYTW